MGTLKTVIRIEVPGADSGIGKMRELSRATEDFTKKLKNADFSFNGRRNANDKNRFDYAISEAEQKLKSANFSVGPKATDGLKKITEQIGLTKQQALTLTYTFNDVAASLASGASPFTILLQQGGQVTQAFGGIRGTFSALAPIVLRLAPAIAAVGAAVAAVSFLKMGNDAAKAAVELRNLSDRANVSFETFQKLSGVASIKGLAPEDTAGGLERLSQALGKAAKSYRDLGEGATADETVKFFDKLGADFRGFTGNSAQVERAIKQLSRGLAGLSGAERFDALQQLRSLVGPEFAQFIARSGRSIDQLAKQYNVAANSISKADLAIAEQQTAASAAFGQAWDKASARLSATFTPATLAATRFLESIRSSGSGAFDPLNSALASTSNALRDFFLILSGDRAAAQRSPAIAILVQGLSAAGIAASIAADAIGKAFEAIQIAAELVAGVINDVFGTNFSTGGAIAIAAITLVISRMNALRSIVLAVASAFASLAIASVLNPWVVSIGLVGAALLAVVANIEAVKASFARLAQDFDTGVVQRARVWLKLLEAGAAFRPWNTAAYSQAVDEAIALEFKRQDAIKQIAASRVEEDKKAAEQGKTILGNTAEYVKGLWADSGAQSFMDGIVSQIGKATQSLSGLSGQANSTISNIQAAGTAAANTADQAVANSFQKVAPGRWKKVFDEAQVEADQFVKVGVGRWKQQLDGAQEETSRFVRGADGFWRLVTQGADQATAASERAAGAIRKVADAQQALRTNIPQVSQTPAQQAQTAQPQASPLAATIAEANTAIDALKQKLAQAISDAQALAAGAVSIVANSIVSSVGTANTSIDSLTEALNRAIQSVQQLASALSSLPALPDYSGSNTGGGVKVNGGGGAPMASGGLVTGPGTATSDSIPAWLSAGEFVVRAAAVSHYGVDFLRRINGLRISTPRMAPLRFADGGLVSSMSRALGPASGGSRSLTLVLEGKSFGGLTGPSTVIADLEKHAISRRIASTTKRAPSWER